MSTSKSSIIQRFLEEACPETNKPCNTAFLRVHLLDYFYTNDFHISLYLMYPYTLNYIS